MQIDFRRYTNWKKYDEIIPGILGFKIKKHIIFYRRLKTGNVEIVRILHGKMDFKKKIE